MKHFVLIAVILVAFVAAPGCGSDGDAPKPMATETQVEDMVKARALFDKAQGDWSRLSGMEQEEYNKLVGGTKEKGEWWWNKMKNPQGAPQVPGNAPGPSGPGTGG